MASKILKRLGIALTGMALAIGVGVGLSQRGEYKEARADTATIAYSGGKTTNMTGNNDAATLGLNASNWSVVATKGGGSNMPGLNKANDIRLYYHEDGSNIITVTSLQDYTISSITVSYTSSDYNNGLVKVGDTTKPDTDGKNDDKSTHTIGSTSFVITNGNTSSVQVRIKSIVITYSSAQTTPVTITGNRSVSTSITYTCNGGVSSTWALSNVTPAGCMTIDGSTVTAVFKGTANLTCTPSDASYSATTIELTSTAAARHQLPAGSYYISASGAANNPQLSAANYGSTNPSAVALDLFTSSKAWTFVVNSADNDAYDIKVANDGQYLIATKGSGTEAIMTNASTEGYWYVTKNNDLDSNGNFTYRLSFSLFNTRFLGLYDTASSNFRYYTSGKSDNIIDLNLIPASRTLSSMTVSGTLEKTNYVKDETFVSTGAVVTGTYTSSAGNCVINIPLNQVTWSPSTLSSTGTIQVKAVVDTVESTNSFEVTVAAASVPATGVTISPSNPEVYEGNTVQLSATVTPNTATDKTVTWSSDDEDVATVDENGLVTGVAPGTTYINVSANGGTDVEDIVEITVNAKTYINKVTSVSDLWDGQQVYLVDATAKYTALKYASGNYVTSETAVLADAGAKFSLTDTISAYAYRVGRFFNSEKEEIQYTFSYEDNESTYYLYCASDGGAASLKGKTTIDDLCYWTVSIVDGQATIENVGARDLETPLTRRFMYFNASTHGLNSMTTGNKVSFYAVTEYEEGLYAANYFEENRMYMSTYDPTLTTKNTNDGAGTCTTYYPVAKQAWNAMSTGERNLVSNDAKERLAAWAAANGDSYAGGNGAIASSKVSFGFTNTLSEENTTTTLIAVAIVVTSISVIGGYFFIRRRKER